MGNSYGATLLKVERLSHWKGLRWYEVHWTDMDGEDWSARTVPGGSVNREVETLLQGTVVNVILNGRGQVVALDPLDPKSEPEPKGLTPATISQADIDALVQFATEVAGDGYLSNRATARGLLKALGLPLPRREV